jgi:hypothetical protein
VTTQGCCLSVVKWGPSVQAALCAPRRSALIWVADALFARACSSRSDLRSMGAVGQPFVVHRAGACRVSPAFVFGTHPRTRAAVHLCADTQTQTTGVTPAAGGVGDARLRRGVHQWCWWGLRALQQHGGPVAPDFAAARTGRCHSWYPHRAGVLRLRVPRHQRADRRLHEPPPQTSSPPTYALMSAARGVGRE